MDGRIIGIENQGVTLNLQAIHYTWKFEYKDPEYKIPIFLQNFFPKCGHEIRYYFFPGSLFD